MAYSWDIFLDKLTCGDCRKVLSFCVSELIELIDCVFELQGTSRDKKKQIPFVKCIYYFLKTKTSHIEHTVHVIVLTSAAPTWIPMYLELCAQNSGTSFKAQNLSCQMSSELIKTHLSLSVTSSQELDQAGCFVSL